jgi:hypothetical protein
MVKTKRTGKYLIWKVKMRKLLAKILIMLVLASTSGCYLAPRTAWTPKKYKKKTLSHKAPKTKR